MRSYWLLPSLLGLVLAALPAHAGGRLLKWQFDQEERQLEIVTETSVAPRAQLVPNPTRIVIDLPNTRLGSSSREKKLQKRFNSLRAGQFDQDTTRLVTYGSLIFRVGRQIVAQGEYKSRLGSSLTSKSFAGGD